MFARSQPNLLCLGDEIEEEGHTIVRDTENHIPLRTALSNPNLLDSETAPSGDSNSVDKVLFHFFLIPLILHTKQHQKL